MYKATFQGYSRRDDKWFPPFIETGFKSEADIRLRALALNWSIVKIEKEA